MAASKQANGCCSYFTKCQLIPSLGETALLRKQFEAQRSRTVWSKKSAKQEQIEGNWSATLFPSYPYTVYSSSALEIPLVKELH